jgi:hypothetical protein
MRHVAPGLLVGLSICWTIPVGAQTYLPQPVGPAIQEVPTYPPDQVYGPMTDEGVPMDVAGGADDHGIQAPRSR